MDNNKIDVSVIQMKRWVNVQSKYQPTQAELGIVAKGLAFSIDLNRIPMKKIVMVTEVVCQQLGAEEAHLLRKEVVGVIQNAKQS